MSAEIACKQNILVTDFHLLKLLLVVLGFGSQINVCGFSRQNICSVIKHTHILQSDRSLAIIVEEKSLQAQKPPQEKASRKITPEENPSHQNASTLKYLTAKHL